MIAARVKYGIVILMAFIIYRFYNTIEIKVVLFTLFILPFVSMGIAFLCNKKITLEQTIKNNKIQRCGSTNLLFSVNNSGAFFCPYVYIEFKSNNIGVKVEKGETYFAVLGNSKTDYNFNVSGIYRGVYEIGINSCYTEDFLHLFRFNLKKPEKLKIKIIPKLYKIDDFILNFNDNVLTDQHIYGKNEDPSSVYDITDYDPTKDFRKIHWKLSARTDELMVRKFETEGGVSAAVIADFSELSDNHEFALPFENKLAEAFVSVIYNLINNEDSIDFIYSDAAPVIYNNFNISMFNQILDICTVNQFRSSVSASDLLDYYISSNIPCKNIFIITPHINDELINSIGNSISKGLYIKIIWNKNPKQLNLNVETSEFLKNKEIKVISVGNSETDDFNNNNNFIKTDVSR